MPVTTPMPKEMAKILSQNCERSRKTGRFGQGIGAFQKGDERGQTDREGGKQDVPAMTQANWMRERISGSKRTPLCLLCAALLSGPISRSRPNVGRAKLIDSAANGTGPRGRERPAGMEPVGMDLAQLRFPYQN